MLPQKNILNSLIRSQVQGMWYQLAFSVTLLAFGVLVICLGLRVHAQGEALKQLVTMGGTFITSLTTLPIKEVLNRRERVSTLREMIRIRPRPAAAEQARLDDIAWKTVENIVAG